MPGTASPQAGRTLRVAAGARGRPASHGQAELQLKRPHPPASAKADEGPERGGGEGGGRRPRTCRWRGHPSWGRPGIQSPCALTGAAEQVLGGGRWAAGAKPEWVVSAEGAGGQRAGDRTVLERERRGPRAGCLGVRMRTASTGWCPPKICPPGSSARPRLGEGPLGDDIVEEGF